MLLGLIVKKMQEKTPGTLKSPLANASQCISEGTRWEKDQQWISPIQLSSTRIKAIAPSTTVSLPCLVMLQRESRSFKGHQISEKFDTNEEVK